MSKANNFSIKIAATCHFCKKQDECTITMDKSSPEVYRLLDTPDSGVLKFQFVRAVSTCPSCHESERLMWPLSDFVKDWDAVVSDLKKYIE